MSMHMDFGELRSLMHAPTVREHAVWRAVGEHADPSDARVRYAMDHLSRREDGALGWTWHVQAQAAPALVFLEHGEFLGSPIGRAPLSRRDLGDLGRRAFVARVRFWGKLGLVESCADVHDVVHQWAYEQVRSMFEEYGVEHAVLIEALETKRRWIEGLVGDDALTDALWRAASVEFRVPFDHMQPTAGATAALCEVDPASTARQVARWVWEPSRHFGDGQHSDDEWARLGRSLRDRLLEVSFPMG